MAPLVRTGGSRHTGLAALPHRNIHDDFSHIVTVDEQNELRNSINETRKEEGLPLLTEEEWPSATTALTKTFFADHAISKIIESYNSGEILKEGMSAWY